MSRPVGTEKDVKYEARPGMFGDNTPSFQYRYWAENQLKISQIALDENQLKKSRDDIHNDWTRTN